ncbi:hypothetical protein H0Z60_17665 [Ectothiorhodospiraceae bacterium WFHF3C12]|nr:hypothetical protein [Ectothiorhodospiraceae bacterium WFHF3C12]
MRERTRFAVFGSILAATSGLVGCASDGGLGGVADAMERIADRAGSENPLLTTSRVETSGTIENDRFHVEPARSQVITPVQLEDSVAYVRKRYLAAKSRRDTEQLEHWRDVARELKDEFKTANDVIVFRITNHTQDPLDGSAVRFLLRDQQGARVPHAALSDATLKILNQESYFVDPDTGKRVVFTAGDWGVIPPLSTTHVGVIVPATPQGTHTAQFSNVPGIEERVEFNVVHG